MKHTITSLFLAALMSMAGMNALALEQNAQGIFEISSAQDLVDFATLVNDGQNSAGAVLTADIDMASITNFTPIGNAEGRPYIGVFDGQDHALSNLTVNVATYAGLFGYVSGGVTVKNLVLDASCVINATEGGYAGIIGGSTGGGNVTMSRLGNEGTVTAAGPNAGGIIGVNMGNAAAFLIENCYATGTVTGVNESGAITGWVGGAGSSIRGCWATATVEGIESGKPFYRGEPTEVKNCYNLTGEQAAKITQEQLESGEFAYNLNRGVTDTPIWFQTLDEDKHPVILSSHKAVYWGGAINCDGKIIPSSGTYTNTVTTHEIPPHEYEDGICKNCGSIDPNASPLQPNADGVYEIGTASNLVAFSKLVNDGNYKINAVLTADIDMSRVANFIPIGLSSENATAYVGTFDGQFHTISHLTIHRDADNVSYVGLFGHVYKGGVVKNLYLKTVNITTDSGKPIATGAVMGRNGAATMINVAAVDVTFNLAAEGDGATTSHGGLTGALANSTSTRMENCFTNHPSLGYVGGKAKLINSFTGEDVEQMGPTGELCHTLNGDQSAIVWYQTLGEDPYPVFDSTHKVVYALGRMNCDGTPSVGELTYSNDPGGIEIPPHEYDHGFCVNCGFFNPDYKQPVDGFYELDDGMDVYWFSHLVNTGMLEVNARLTDDVDMSSIENFPSIGNKKYQYKGTFDGQHHTVSNLHMEYELDYTGFLGAVAGGAALKNITFDSSCTIIGKNYTGAVGGFYDGMSGDITISNVGFEGEVAGTKKYAAGIIGGNKGADATFYITDCYSTGTISGASNNAAIAAWTGDNRGTLASCWSSAEVINAEDDAHYLYQGKINSERLFCTKGTQGTIVTDAQIKSGELAYMLNNSSVLNVGWYQDIGEDEHPVTDSSHGLVFPSLEGFIGINSYDFTTMRDYLLTQMNTEADEAIAYRPTIDAVMAAVDEVHHAEANDRETFAEIYSAKLVEAINIFRESKAAYQNFMDIVAEAVSLSREICGPSAETELLENYLEGEAGSSELYPNGTYYYIIDQMQLTNEQILQEGVFVRQMLEAAIRNSYKVGANITILMENPKFEEPFSTGWEGTYGTGKQAYTLSNGTFVGAESWSASPFDIHQTLTGMKQGLYLLEVTAASRPSSDHDTQLLNHTASIYLNGTENYIMTAREAAINAEEAIDGVTANITGEVADIPILNAEEEAIAYMPHGVLSVAIMANAGRAKNYIVTQVTDSTLTMGIRNRHSHQGNDWTGFAQPKLTYLGSMDSEEAASGVALALESQLARAATILNDYEPGTFTDDYMLLPNYSQAQKDELAALVEQAAQATTTQAKYEIVEKLSALYAGIYSCKQAYVTMHRTADELTDAYGILGTAEEQKAIQPSIDKVMDAYSYGTVNEEEAKALSAQMQADAYYLKQYGGAILTPLIQEAKTLSKEAKGSSALITSTGQFSTNCAWDDQGSLDYLLDGNINTYFHSIANTSGALTVQSGQEYLQVNFAQPVEAFYLEFTGRSDGQASGAEWHDTPNQVTFKVSNTPEDETSWTEVGTETYDLPNTHGVHYMATSPTKLGGKYTSVRMYILSVTSGNHYWNLSEIQMYEYSTQSKYSISQEVKDAVDALDALVAADEAKIASRTVQTSDFETLQEAIEQLRALLEATGIETLQADRAERQGEGAIYDLSGRRIKNRSNLPRGIYIVGGRKVMVR